ncbi:hypothetical protein TKK_0015657 [Trichogramma kaykai]
MPSSSNEKAKASDGKHTLTSNNNKQWRTSKPAFNKQQNKQYEVKAIQKKKVKDSSEIDKEVLPKNAEQLHPQQSETP